MNNQLKIVGTSSKDKNILECINNRIIVSSKIEELRDLNIVKEILNENYYNGFEFAIDAIVNNKQKEFFKFLIDKGYERLANCFMTTCSRWEISNDFWVSACATLNFDSNGFIGFRAGNRNPEIIDGLQEKCIITPYDLHSHELCKNIFELLNKKENNLMLQYFKNKKQEIYKKVENSILAEKKVEQEKIEKQKIVKGLTKNYFINLLSSDGEELFIIKLCSLLDAIFKFDYHYDGNEFVDRMNAHFKNLEDSAPKSRDCDDGWGYMVLDKEYEENIVIPEQNKIKYLRDLFYRLRVQRNNIVHSEFNKIQELSDVELKEALEYVFSINKVEE